MVGSSAAKPFFLEADLYNAHLFGNTALYLIQGRSYETGFYFQDDRRVGEIIDRTRFRKRDRNWDTPRVFGFLEVWDRGKGERISEGLSDIYPYSYIAPAKPGIGGKITEFAEKYPWTARFFDKEENIVTRCCRHHYRGASDSFLSGLKDFILQDAFALALNFFLGGAVLNSGLLFLSNYPFSGDFELHPQRVEWERLADKGVLHTTLELPGDLYVSVDLGHFQEGTSKRAKKTRARQIRAAQDWHRGASQGVITLADFNVERDSSEFQEVFRGLGLREARTEETFRDIAGFQQKLEGVPAQALSSARHVDFIMYKGLLALLNAGVDDYFDGLSDHRLLGAIFEVGQSVVSGAQVYMGQEQEIVGLTRAA